MNDLLTKLFVRVPAGTSVTLDTLKTESEGNKKIYFVEDLNLIVHNGRTYGIDPKTSTTITSLINVIGGSADPADGTVTVDFSNLEYYNPEGDKKKTIIDAIKALDATIKVEMDKLGASKTLNANYEFTGEIRYVAAKDGVAAHIALVDEDKAELSTINVSDIIGNGILKSSSYNKDTGILTLTFAQADGTEKAISVDLKAMLDINDISIAEASKKYLEVTLGTAEPEGETQAVFGAKVKKIVGAGADADLTGLADAKDVKDYVDGKTTDLAITADGDDYVKASVNADVDKKHVIVDANVQDVTASAGTRGTWSVSDAGVANLSGETAPSISGVASSLMDGEQAINAVKTYVDAAIAAEAAERVAKISAAVKALDKNATETTGSNVHVTMSEVDGIVSIDSVVEDYATVTRVATTSTSVAHATNASLTVTEGDEAKLVKASDLKAVADYAADKVTEEEHRVDKKIKDLGGSATGANAGNCISVTVTSAHGEVSGVTVEFDPWETYGVTQSTN